MSPTKNKIVISPNIENILEYNVTEEQENTRKRLNEVIQSLVKNNVDPVKIAEFKKQAQDYLALQVKRHQDNIDLMEIQLEDAISNATGGQTKEEYDAEVSDTYATKTNPRYKQTERFPTDVDGNMLLKALQLPIHTIGMEVDPNTNEIISRGRWAG